MYVFFFEADGANQQNKLAFAPPSSNRCSTDAVQGGGKNGDKGASPVKNGSSLEGKEEYCVFIEGRP